MKCLDMGFPTISIEKSRSWGYDFYGMMHATMSSRRDSFYLDMIDY